MYYLSETCPRYLTKAIYQLSWNEYNKAWLNTNLAKTSNLFTVQFQELLPFVRIFWETYRFNSRELFTFTCFHRVSTRNRIPPPLQGHPTIIFGEHLFGRRFEIYNFQIICCKISCLPASPRIFEHLKYGIIAHFLTDLYPKKVT